jgi:hypothetical protein
MSITETIISVGKKISRHHLKGMERKIKSWNWPRTFLVEVSHQQQMMKRVFAFVYS